jgi:hypothetical protein
MNAKKSLTSMVILFWFVALVLALPSRQTVNASVDDLVIEEGTCNSATFTAHFTREIGGSEEQTVNGFVLRNNRNFTLGISATIILPADPTYSHTWSYTFPEQPEGTRIEIYVDHAFGSGYDGIFKTYICSSTEIPINGTAGCDAFVDIPDTAVGGQFIKSTPVFWGPDPSMMTGIIIEVGKTAWVLGIDESGQYYKILWSCQSLWVPVNAIGPNYDEVWNGQPLPTVVVE